MGAPLATADQKVLDEDIVELLIEKRVASERVLLAD